MASERTDRPDRSDELIFAWTVEIMTFIVRCSTFLVIMYAWTAVPALFQSVVFGAILMNLLYSSKLTAWLQRLFPGLPVGWTWGA